MKNIVMNYFFNQGEKVEYGRDESFHSMHSVVQQNDQNEGPNEDLDEAYIDDGLTSHAIIGESHFERLVNETGFSNRRNRYENWKLAEGGETFEEPTRYRGFGGSGIFGHRFGWIHSDLGVIKADIVNLGLPSFLGQRTSFGKLESKITKQFLGTNRGNFRLTRGPLGLQQVNLFTNHGSFPIVHGGSSSYKDSDVESDSNKATAGSSSSKKKVDDDIEAMEITGAGGIMGVDDFTRPGKLGLREFRAMEPEVLQNILVHLRSIGWSKNGKDEINEKWRPPDEGGRKDFDRALKFIYEHSPSRRKIRVRNIQKLPRYFTSNIHDACLMDIFYVGGRMYYHIMFLTSRFSYVVPTKEKTMLRTRTILSKFKMILGFPRCMIMDAGKGFMGKGVISSLRSFGVLPIFNSAASPSSLGRIEHRHFLIKAAIDELKQDERVMGHQGNGFSIDELVMIATSCINETPQLSLGFVSPAYVQLGRESSWVADFSSDSFQLPEDSAMKRNEIKSQKIEQIHLSWLNSVEYLNMLNSYRQSCKDDFSYSGGDRVLYVVGKRGSTHQEVWSKGPGTIQSIEMVDLPSTNTKSIRCWIQTPKTGLISRSRNQLYIHIEPFDYVYRGKFHFNAVSYTHLTLPTTPYV